MPPRIGDAAALAWLLGLSLLIVTPDVLAGSSVHLTSMIIVLCALAAGLCSLRMTVVAALLTATVRPLLYLAEPPASVADGVVSAVVTAMIAALCVVGARLRIRREGEVFRVRSTAAALQRQILSPLPLSTAHVEVHGLYEPVEEDSFVGGDIYEAMDTPHGTRVLIGDVRGKGLVAIGAGFAVLTAFREAAWHRATLDEVVDALEVALRRHNDTAARAGAPERFTTALVLAFDGSPTVRIVNCGHIPPYRLRGDGCGPVPLGAAGVPLGLADLVPDPRPVEEFELGPEDLLLLCTDGVTEARDRAGEFYPLEDRLPAWQGLGPAATAEALRRELHAYAPGRARDDVTALVLRRVGATGPEPAAETERT